MLFASRESAGRKLARALREYAAEGTLILALPRGGMIVGAKVAEALGSPLDLILVRKIGHPACAEYAVGAIADNDKAVYNQAETATLDKTWLKEAEESARKLIARRQWLYFHGAYKPPQIEGKTVIIVDDGIATGLTMQAAVLAVRDKRPKKIVVAIPVASPHAIDALRALVDELEVITLDNNFRGTVGAHYIYFPEIDDGTVKKLLERRVRHGLQQATSAHAKA